MHTESKTVTQIKSLRFIAQLKYYHYKLQKMLTHKSRSHSGEMVITYSDLLSSFTIIGHFLLNVYFICMNNRYVTNGESSFLKTFYCLLDT